MGVRVLAMRVVLLLSLLGSLGCSIQIPDGVFSCRSDAECPSDFRCRASGDERRCIRGMANAADGGDALRPDVGVRAAADGGDALRPDVGVTTAADGGDALPPDAAAGGSDPLGSGMVTNTAPAAPTLHGFTTSGATALDGFEKGARVCTSNGRYCVTGAFEP